MSLRYIKAFIIFIALINSSYSEEGTSNLEPMEVNARADDMTGIAESSSQGIIGKSDLKKRPILRSGELLEVVPGVAVTQHSGTGKANQYFLRGFNLDHGTDFNASFDGVPLNLPTHGHGQGYLDLNPIIPELINSIEFGKGPYYTDIGDFSSAGYAKYNTVSSLPNSLQIITVGEDNFYRSVLANSYELNQGDFLYGLEFQHYDGPWVEEENAKKVNILLKYSKEQQRSGYSLTGTSYYGEWDSTDQIPERAVDQGLISRFDQIDDDLGGRAQRHSINSTWWFGDTDSIWQANFYAFYSTLDLWSNFTYFLNDPLNGDQFKQEDERLVIGGNSNYAWLNDAFGMFSENTIGLQLRHDYIPSVGLFQSQERNIIRTIREDRVNETSLGVYFSNETFWSNWLRTNVGLRGDAFRFDVDSKTIEANSGKRNDLAWSPKFGMVLGPWYSTEYYFNIGKGFHSNDARGTTIEIDPETNLPIDTVDPLVESKGIDIGARTSIFSNLNSSVTLWYLELDSELVFVGDAGTTEPSGESERYGIEFSNAYRPNDWLTLDLDIAFTNAKFTDEEDEEIPNSIGRVITAGAAVDFSNGLFGAIRARHFGDGPLVEDNSADGGSTTVVNLQAGYSFLENIDIRMDVFNLFNSSDNDISYFFESRLPGEPSEGISDVHFHSVEPRTIRLTLQLSI